MVRYCLILGWLLLASCGYAQQQRLTSLTFKPQTNFFSGTTNVFINASNDATLIRFTATNNFGIHVTNIISLFDGKEFRIEVKQDATGNRIGVPAGPSNIRFGTDITGWTFSTNANYIDQIKIVIRGTNACVVGFLRGYQEQ